MLSRAATQAIIRGVAMIVALAVVCTMTAGVLYVLLDDGFERGSMILRGNIRWTLQHEISWSVPLALAAIGLWVLQKPLAKYITRPGVNICVECGYSLRKLKSDRCPECGCRVRNQSSAEG